ncbi:MAG: OmpA family protein [Alphaproteobacteria bacterium]|nr:OmpA family protein [Alphaproteobacteria bacterium]OJV17133.1 MAG: hypothetical protein BGO27_06100 [Alphaproteobacteria bacterium 33-17]
MKKSLLLLPLVMLSNCMYIDRVHHKPTADSEFNRQLSKNYTRMADSEAAGYDWKDANLFAKKAIWASKNKEVLPEDPTKWSIKGDLMSEFVEYHDIVMTLNTPKNKKKHPKQLANLISSFDAMVEEHSENDSLDQILMKRDAFVKNVKFFLGHAAFLPHESVIHSEVLFFHNDSSKVGRVGKAVIGRAIHKAMNDGGFSKVIISAHADKPGSEMTNNMMSLERAAAVKTVLMHMGVSEKMIEVVNYGEEKPVVHTKKPVMKNRRVEIDFVR